MKRRLIAAVWIAAATVPVLLTTVFLVGCCVLPFHAVMHKLMPICQMAASVMRGDVDPGPENPAVPAESQDRRDAVKRIVTTVPGSVRVLAANTMQRLLPPAAATGYRSYISLGAIRCDRDVGLYVLAESFLV